MARLQASLLVCMLVLVTLGVPEPCQSATLVTLRGEVACLRVCDDHKPSGISDVTVKLSCHHNTSYTVVTKKTGKFRLDIFGDFSKARCAAGVVPSTLPAKCNETAWSKQGSFTPDLAPSANNETFERYIPTFMFKQTNCSESG